jgi:hypothetical protein
MKKKGLVSLVGDLVPATYRLIGPTPACPGQHYGNQFKKYKTKVYGDSDLSLQEERPWVPLVPFVTMDPVLRRMLIHLFEVFYRSDPSRQNPHRGSGLGLAIAAMRYSV